MNNNKEKNLEIIGAKKDEDGVITDFKLSDGRVVSKDQAVQIHKNEGINNVHITRTRGENSKEILVSNPSAGKEHFLSNLPSFR